MRDYILRRLVSMVPVLFIVSIIAFGLLYVLPGDPAIAIMGENAGNRQTYLALRRELGLDQPLYMQYWSWLEKVLRGDLGKSIRTNEAVADILLRRAPISLHVGLAGWIVGILIGMPVAILSAVRPGSRLDSLGTLFALGGVAIPSFFEIPGVGRAAVDAIFFRDYPVLQGAVLMLTGAALIANLVTDLAYAYVDPRIRYR